MVLFPLSWGGFCSIRHSTPSHISPSASLVPFLPTLLSPCMHYTGWLPLASCACCSCVWLPYRMFGVWHFFKTLCFIAKLWYCNRVRSHCVNPSQSFVTAICVHLYGTAWDKRTKKPGMFPHTSTTVRGHGVLIRHGIVTCDGMR